MEKINLKEFTNETRLKENGVYLITHIPTGIKYVGSTFSPQGFSGRWRAHLNGLRRGIGNACLLHLYNKYGISGFRFSIIEIVKDNKLARQRERYWIEYYDTYKNGANATLETEQSLKGVKHRGYTQEEKISIMLNSPTRKKVYLYNKEGKLLYVFPSTCACDRFFDLEKRRTNWVINHPLRSICNRQYYPSYELKSEGWNPEKEQKKAYINRAKRVAFIRKKNGTYWMGQEYKNKIREGSPIRKSVALATLDGNVVRTFKSLNECDDYLSLTRGATSKVLKGKAKTLKRKYIPILI